MLAVVGIRFQNGRRHPDDAMPVNHSLGLATGFTENILFLLLGLRLEWHTTLGE